MTISIQGQRFIDGEGRGVLLHGINLVNKDPGAGYVFDEGPALFAALHDWGFNVVRLGVIWDGLEPEPGVYDEDYLRRLDQQVAWAKAHGLWVFLDMHQDLYSVLFSDGAPAWATLTGGAPHVAPGAVWSDAYFTSPAVQAALDAFWANAPAPDGVGLQDHYARAWALLARRYADEDAIIGYDIMNEPFPGSAAMDAQALMFAKGAALLAKRGGGLGGAAPAGTTPAEALAASWLTPEGRAAILAQLDDVELYAEIIDATSPVYGAFERKPLVALYHRVARAIRMEDPAHAGSAHAGPAHALFLETSMGANMGVRSAISPVVLDGVRDPAQVYAPHGYDLVVDTPEVAGANHARVDLIFRRHGETAARLGMPLLVGEWGAYGRHPGTLPAAWHVVHQFEALLCGETYWSYETDLPAAPCFPALNRPYPERVAGALVSYHCDPDNALFEATWREGEKVTAPSRIYLPAWFATAPFAPALHPEGAGFRTVDAGLGTGNVYVEIPPVGRSCTRRFVIRS